jgi:hypothetical protein
LEGDINPERALAGGCWTNDGNDGLLRRHGPV